MELNNRIKELIAIGASITANCEPCLEHHVRKSIEYNAEEQEIKEAIEIGKMVRRGASVNIDKFSADLKKSSAPNLNTAEVFCEA